MWKRKLENILKNLANHIPPENQVSIRNYQKNCYKFCLNEKQEYTHYIQKQINTDNKLKKLMKKK